MRRRLPGVMGPLSFALVSEAVRLDRDATYIAIGKWELTDGGRLWISRAVLGAARAGWFKAAPTKVGIGRKTGDRAVLNRMLPWPIRRLALLGYVLGEPLRVERDQLDDIEVFSDAIEEGRAIMAPTWMDTSRTYRMTGDAVERVCGALGSEEG